MDEVEVDLTICLDIDCWSNLGLNSVLSPQR